MRVRLLQSVLVVGSSLDLNKAPRHFQAAMHILIETTFANEVFGYFEGVGVECFTLEMAWISLLIPFLIHICSCCYNLLKG